MITEIRSGFILLFLIGAVSAQTIFIKELKKSNFQVVFYAIIITCLLISTIVIILFCSRVARCPAASTFCLDVFLGAVLLCATIMASVSTAQNDFSKNAKICSISAQACSYFVVLLYWLGAILGPLYSEEDAID